MPDILHKQLDAYGIGPDKYEIEVPNTKVSDQDPEILFLNYKSVFEEKGYLPDRVQIEIGARSLNEPFSRSTIQAIIDEIFPDAGFKEGPFKVKAITPEKTFLEKLILLHEEFQKPAEKIRIHRMSRHLYDIYSICKTKYGESALKDEKLFRAICNHRTVFTPVIGVDYERLKLSGLNILPTGNFVDLFKDDYQAMRENMIYVESPEFGELLETVGSVLR